MSDDGRCLLLAGASSAGKSTLASAIQASASRPWFLFEGDVFSGGFPSARPEFVTLEWDRRVRKGCARAALGLVEAGLDVIVELWLWDSWARKAVAQVFSGRPAFVVRVACDFATLEAREQSRGDRVIGTASRQAAELDGLPFDYEVLTDHKTPDVLAAGVLVWLGTDPRPDAVASLAG